MFAVPSQLPQVALVLASRFIEISVGSVIVTDEILVHELASETVTLYAP